MTFDTTKPLQGLFAYQPPEHPNPAVQAQVTYTPNGVPRQPGFYNPDNPYDTGRHGETNRELNGGKGGRVDWWDYDKGAPKAGVTLNQDGMYTLGGGGGGPSVNPKQGVGPMANPYLAGAQLAAGLMGIKGFTPAAPPPLASDTTLGAALGGLSGLAINTPANPPSAPADIPRYEGAPTLAALQAILGNRGPRLGGGSPHIAI